MTHICVGNLTIIGSDNGLSPGRRQAITWTNVGILLIGPLWTNFSERLIEIHTFSFNKIHLKMSSGKWRPFSLGLNVLGFHLLSVERCLIFSQVWISRYWPGNGIECFSHTRNEWCFSFELIINNRLHIRVSFWERMQLSNNLWKSVEIWLRKHPQLCSEILILLCCRYHRVLVPFLNETPHQLYQISWLMCYNQIH